jgi:hypothetical protein
MMAYNVPIQVTNIIFNQILIYHILPIAIKLGPLQLHFLFLSSDIIYC